MKIRERVQLPSEDWIICLCGNEPHMDGFEPCLEDGTETEPDIQSVWRGLYVCVRCARIINIQDGGSVIGTASETIQAANLAKWRLVDEFPFRTVYVFEGGEMSAYYDDEHTQEAAVFYTLGTETEEGRVIHTARLFDAYGNLAREFQK